MDKEVFRQAIESGARLQIACQVYEAIPVGRAYLCETIYALREMELAVAEYRADMEAVAREMGLAVRELVSA
jgi:hypothetical protein